MFTKENDFVPEAEQTSARHDLVEGLGIAKKLRRRPPSFVPDSGGRYIHDSEARIFGPRAKIELLDSEEKELV